MIQPWRERLDWTGERSPSSAQRMKAMQAEIDELRRALRRKEQQIERNEAKVKERIDNRLAAMRRKVLFYRRLADAERNKGKEALKTAGIPQPNQIVYEQVSS